MKDEQEIIVFGPTGIVSTISIEKLKRVGVPTYTQNSPETMMDILINLFEVSKTKLTKNTPKVMHMGQKTSLDEIIQPVKWITAVKMGKNEAGFILPGDTNEY